MVWYIPAVTYATVNGQQLYFEDHGGEGPPVILSHGFLLDHEMFSAQVGVLAEDYRVITWDERGFGQTEYDGKPFSYWDSASDCLGLLDHLGIDRAVLAGMSQGGFLSLRAAMTAPDRVRALILLDTEAGVPAPETAAMEQGMVDFWLAVGPVDDLANPVADLIIGEPVENAKWIAKWRSVPNDAILEPAHCLHRRDDITDRLGEITCPALVVHGTEDMSIPMDKAEALSAGLVGSTGVVKVPGGHAANLTHPEAVNAAIVDFLAQLPD
jgi:3-oxoadipate enol-lactonase